MSKKSNYHIVPDPDRGWAIKKEGSVKVSAFSATQHGAEKKAKTFAANNRGGEVVIHRRDGKIRDKDTIYPASDPFPPRDRRH